MTLKIVQGLINQNSSYTEIRGTSTAKASAGSVRAYQASSVSAAQVNSLAQHRGAERSLSEAVVSSVRSSRSTSSEAAKIREFEEAKEVSRDVAEKIRDGESPDAAHGETRFVVDRESTPN